MIYEFGQLKEKFDGFLAGHNFGTEPHTLYDPVRYIMSLGGKRIRPLLCMASYNLFKTDVEKSLPAALSLEVFHNFSLVHDDLMDDADIRRSQPSVHIKYDTNTAILSGDVMLIQSFRLLEAYPERFLQLVQLFSKTAAEVCDGQRMDMDFEKLLQPSIDEYIEMIKLKTSVLIACALKMGAIVADADEKDAFHLYEFGKNMGIAFQIQDDLLDTFGDANQVGKKIGGDILQKKKTYLYLKSLELLSDLEAETLRQLYAHEEITDEAAHIAKVKALFKTAHVNVHAEELKLVYQQLAFSHLDALTIEDKRKKVLNLFANQLLNRAH